MPVPLLGAFSKLPFFLGETREECRSPEGNQAG